jgi:hypothetical protein
MTTQLDEDSVLTSFKKQALPPRFREYYAAKRQNLFASIQAFPPLWKCFMSLDEIWFRELEDMRTATNATQLLPLTLYMNSHVKTRLSFELAFSSCLPEAYSPRCGTRTNGTCAPWRSKLESGFSLEG